MTPQVLTYVKDSLAPHPSLTGRVLDVGSYDVNGNARSIFTDHGLHYTGLDIAPGPNVDVVHDICTLYELYPPGTFICISCLETLEHLQDPVRAVDQMKRALAPGGLLLLTAAGNGFKQHRHPIDCWRILPDGMAFLLSGLDNTHTTTVDYSPGEQGIMGRGTKPANPRPK